MTIRHPDTGVLPIVEAAKGRSAGGRGAATERRAQGPAHPAGRAGLLGLALPGMPGDSPGMGGDESTWSQQSVVAVTAEGSLEPFIY